MAEPHEGYPACRGNLPHTFLMSGWNRGLGVLASKTPQPVLVGAHHAANICTSCSKFRMLTSGTRIRDTLRQAPQCTTSCIDFAHGVHFIPMMKSQEESPLSCVEHPGRAWLNFSGWLAYHLNFSYSTLFSISIYPWSCDSGSAFDCWSSFTCVWVCSVTAQVVFPSRVSLLPPQVDRLTTIIVD